MASLPRLRRFPKFALIGATGVVVNTGVLHLGYRVVGLPLELASPIAIALAIFSNFNGNNAWTWRGRGMAGHGPYLRRLGRYSLSSGLGGAINYAVLLGLVRGLGLSHVVANLLGIGAGMVSNYLLSEFWVFETGVASATALEEMPETASEPPERSQEPRGGPDPETPA